MNFDLLLLARDKLERDGEKERERGGGGGGRAKQIKNEK